MTDRKTDRVTERQIDRQTTDSDGMEQSYRMTDGTDLVIG